MRLVRSFLQVPIVDWNLWKHKHIFAPRLSELVIKKKCGLVILNAILEIKNI